MSAADTARALGASNKSGTWARARCPVHRSSGATLAMHNEPHALIAHCLAGSAPIDVLAKRRER